MVQNGFFYISKSEFWPFFMNSRDYKSILQYGVSENRTRLFNEYVAVINIETSAFCNRKCAYCPVKYFGSREQYLMEDHLFEKIINELIQIDFRGIIVLSLFNEPLADKDILKRIRYVKEKLPFCYIRMNSNGDYLTHEYLEELNKEGLNEILITLHMNEHETYTDELAEEKLNKFFEKINEKLIVTSKTENHNITCDIKYKKMRMLVVTNNWMEDGCDRGGTVELLKKADWIRTCPCATPFREMIIDVHGDVRLCWNAYVNTDSIASVKDMNLIDIYFSDEMVKIRRDHLIFSEKEGICKSCNTPDNSLVSTKDKREKMLT